MKIDHICFAVRDLREGITYWNDVFGYNQMTEMVENTLQLVRVVFLCKNDSTMVKLIEPLPENETLVKFVNRGGGFHHICFKCAEIKMTIKELTGKGLITLVPPQPGKAFNNHDIAFMLAKHGLSIELIDTDEKAGIIQV